MPLDAVRVGKVHRTFFPGPVAERHSKARLFIYLSDSRAKHFPRLLYQTRYEDICFVPISLRARGWPVSKQAGPRCPRYHASIRGDESAKASGNTRNQRREGIFCESRRPEARVLSKGRKGPAGVGPVLSGAGRLFTSDCRGRHGRHDPRRALRRSRRVLHHRLARRRNYRARRCAPSEDALR
jgi:hypothetical protein